LQQKDKCEDDFAETAQDARFQSLEVDELSDDILRADSKIADINAQIQDQNASINELKAQLAGLTQSRSDERAEYLSNQAEDQKAVELIGKAMIILENWMTSGETTPPPGFLQMSDSANSAPMLKKSLVLNSRNVHMHTGVQPAPPPTTWSEPSYTGASSSAERTGILSILNLLKEDMEQDITTADTAELGAQADFDKQKAALDKSIEDAEDVIEGYENARADQLSNKVTLSSSRDGKSEELATTIKKYQTLKPGCDFVLMNLEVRWKKRTLEVDGLRKAKAILEGADMIAIAPTTEYGGIRTGLL